MRGEGVITAISGCYPWNSVDSIEVDDSPYDRDSQQDINMCLNCPVSFARCVNCIGKRERSKEKTNMEKFVDLFRKRHTQKEICEELHICERTYFNYKKACAF